MPLWMGGAEGPYVGELDPGEVLGLLSPDHAAGEEVHPVLARPLRRAKAGAAVPESRPQAGGVRLDPVGEHLDALDTTESRCRLAGHKAQQPLKPVIAEVLDVRRVGVERLLDPVEVHRRPDADPRVEPTSGQDVDGGEILSQAQRILPAERDDSGAQLDAAGAL